MFPDETYHLIPDANLEITVERIWGVNKLASIALRGGFILGASHKFIQDAEPNILLSMGDGTYLIGPYKLELIMPRPLWAIMHNSEMFLVSVVNPNWGK